MILKNIEAQTILEKRKTEKKELKIAHKKLHYKLKELNTKQYGFRSLEIMGDSQKTDVKWHNTSQEAVAYCITQAKQKINMGKKYIASVYLITKKGEKLEIGIPTNIHNILGVEQNFLPQYYNSSPL